MPPNAVVREQTRRSEHEVALGVSDLYKVAQAEEQSFLGVKTVVIPPESVREFRGHFPNGLTNGITVHIYEEGAREVPPVKYMVEQKVLSIVEAYKKLNPSDARSSEEIIEATGLRERIEDRMSELVGISDDAELVKAAVAFEKQIIQESLMKLYQMHEMEHFQSILPVEKFCKSIIMETQHVRSNARDTVTINEGTGRYSYDEAGAVTAHDRALDQGCSNLGMVFEGGFGSEGGVIAFRPHSFLVKHASLVPLDAIKEHGKVKREDRFIDEMRILKSTRNHAREIVDKQASILRHGGAKQPIQLDWCYQLLTTNLFNSEHQEDSYAYIRKGMDLVNGIERDGVTPNVQLLNLGINSLTRLEWYRASLKRRRTNERAILSVLGIEKTDELRDAERELTEKAETLNTLLDGMPEKGKVDSGLETSLKKVMKEYERAQKNVRSCATQAFDQQKTEWKKELSDGGEGFASKLRAAKQGMLANQGNPQEFDRHSAQFFELMMKEMVVSGKYHQRENAPLFHACLSAYQMHQGMMASTGCKSANDRTYVMRMLSAFVNGESVKGMSLPEGTSTAACYKELLGQIQDQMKGNEMSNSALFSCINDTAGGGPKIGKDFSFILKGVATKFLKSFGKFAPHKLLGKGLKKMVEAIKKIFSSRQSNVQPKHAGPRQFEQAQLRERKPVTPEASTEGRPRRGKRM